MFLFILNPYPYTYNTRKYCNVIPRYQTLRTALCTRKSSSLLLSHPMALNFSFTTNRSNMSHSAHVRDTHSCIKNHERMYYNLPLTATIHESPNTKQHKCKKLEFFTGDYRFKLATILASQYMLHHLIRYVLMSKSVVRPYLKKTD